MVYLRLGITGVYYGNAFGVPLKWCNDWPYGPNGIAHPQYQGVILEVLGLALRTGNYYGFAYVLCTALSYNAVTLVEDHYFGEIEKGQKAKEKVDTPRRRSKSKKV